MKWIKNLFTKKEKEYSQEISDISHFLDKSIRELDGNIVEMGVIHINNLLDDESKQKIKEEHEKDNRTWWASHHHGWGTSIRNSLRDNVCLDDKLPTKNWDDYYIQIVEIALGLRNR